MPVISVLITTRDRPDFLLEALESVRCQSRRPLELVLVRDGGAPFTPETLAALTGLGSPVTRIEHDGDPWGTARARNAGLERARGEVVALLDDDDLWEPGHLEALAGAFEADASLDIAYADVAVLDVATGAMRTIAQDFDFDTFARDGFVPPSSMAARREVFVRHGRFDPDFVYSEDWEWMVRVARGGGRFRRVPGFGVTVRIHAGGLSALSPERLGERQRCLDMLSLRHGLAPIEPKTFWEVAGSL